MVAEELGVPTLSVSAIRHCTSNSQGTEPLICNLISFHAILWLGGGVAGPASHYWAGRTLHTYDAYPGHLPLRLSYL